MGDLDFRHSVSQVPAGADLPKVERKVSAEVSGAPDYQSAMQQYAASTNWMSSLGSAVAAKASNAIAVKLGGEAGKNPQGDIGIPLTDFDKAFQESYRTQSQATLGLQADKLITESNLEMAKAPRITPALIAKTNESISLGLQNIFKNAPTETRPHLEYQYQAQQLAQTKQLTERMISEQKEDRKNTLALSTKNNNQAAYTLGLEAPDADKNGDSKAGLAAVKAVEQSYTSAVNMRDATPLEKQVAVDSARQSYLSGKMIRLGLQAEKDRKLGEFQTDVANNPEKYGIRPSDYTNVMNNYNSHMANEQALKRGQENLLSQQMYNQIITDPTQITDAAWMNYASQVTPLQAEQMRFHLIQARNKKTGNEEAVNAVIANNGDARVMANAKPEIKDAAFNKSVAQMMASDKSLSLVQAENMVAASFAAPAPVFTKGIKIGLWSGDAAQMLERAKQIDDLQGNGNGHALSDLAPTDLAIADDIKYNYNPQDPAWSTRMVEENRQNQDPKVREAHLQSFNNMIYQNSTKNNKTPDEYILSKFNMLPGMFHNGFDSPWLQGTYASDIKSVYETNYINKRGDDNGATRLTEQYIKDNYDITYVNGEKQLGKHPLEKTLGFNPGQGLPAIYKDVVRQLDGPLKRLKESYDKGHSPEYWTIDYNEAPGKNAGSLKASMGIEVPNSESTAMPTFTKHTRVGLGEHTEKMPLKLVGNSFNWEINVQTKDGTMSVFLAAPAIGVHRYTPDKQWIQDEYMGRPHIKPNEKYVGMVNQLLAIPESEVRNG